MDEDRWNDPARPPVDGCVDLGGGVWACWAEGWTQMVDGVERPLIWHWCDRSGFRANPREGQADWWFKPRWVGAGVAKHQLVSREPLHLEPSLLWPLCCGLHGFVREGRWLRV